MPDTVSDPLQIIRVGRVTAVNRGAATCQVEVGDPLNGGYVTTDIQWSAMRAGKTIVWSPPSVDEQIVLLCPDGDIAQAVAMPGLFSTLYPAPGNGSREFVQFEDGAEFGYDPDENAADIALPAGATLTIKSTGGVFIEGDVAVEGKITATDIITSDIDVQARPGTPGEVSLVRHIHGSAPTGNVPEPDPEP
ncbi:MAG: phage baseplate assembly protein V [Caenibius sp.]